MSDDFCSLTAFFWHAESALRRRPIDNFLVLPMTAYLFSFARCSSFDVVVDSISLKSLFRFFVESLLFTFYL